MDNCSARLESGRLLIVQVFCPCLELITLLLLSRAHACRDLTELALVLAISKDLLPAHVLLLLGPHTLSILLLLLGHLCLSHLHLTLVHDGSFLTFVHALEVVRLDSVGGEHRCLSCRVLSHEIMVVSVVHIGGGLQLLVVALGKVSIALLLCELHVSILD